MSLGHINFCKQASAGVEATSMLPPHFTKLITANLIADAGKFRSE